MVFGDEVDQFEVLKMPARLLLEETRKSLGKDKGSDWVLITGRKIQDLAKLTGKDASRQREEFLRAKKSLGCGNT